MTRFLEIVAIIVLVPVALVWHILAIPFQILGALLGVVFGGGTNSVKEARKKQIDKKVVEAVRVAVRSQKAEGMAKYQALRKEIEAMPQYQHWRQSVFEKFGRKCAVCGETKNLEVDHRYKSFYAIVQENGITNTVQAYECAELWDVNNGAPLCKEHHDQTKSSVYHNTKTQKQENIRGVASSNRGSVQEVKFDTNVPLEWDGT